MKTKEISHIIIAILIFTFIFGFRGILKNGLNASWYALAWLLLFSIIIIGVSVGTKKIMARLLDSDVEHEMWDWSQYGFRLNEHFRKPVPIGAILPLVVSIVTLGFFKIPAFLTYETRASKYRASKRFGIYSFSEMTDWHHGVIGATGIISVILVGMIGYFQGIEYADTFFKMAAYYAFANVLPISKLDGTQIFFGNKVLWATLAIVSFVALVFGLALGGAI